jgi:ArsR family transcriptional regulator
MQNVLNVMRALADETRLRILNILLERECCVCEVMQALDISQTRASRNLGILEDAGFLKSRRDGTWMHYSIDRQSVNRYAVAVADLLKDFLISDKMLADDRKQLKKAVKIGSTCGSRKKMKKGTGKKT